MKAPITQAQAWAVIAESAGWNAKELPVLPQGYGSIPWAYRGNVFIESQLKAYGAVCAAHAREMALSDSIETLESLWHSSDDGTRKCIAELEQLKARK